MQIWLARIFLIHLVFCLLVRFCCSMLGMILCIQNNEKLFHSSLTALTHVFFVAVNILIFKCLSVNKIKEEKICDNPENPKRKGLVIKTQASDLNPILLLHLKI